jgi:hypothetical protein
MVLPTLPARILPAVDLDNRAYGTSGMDGQLVICRCADRAAYVHPRAQRSFRTLPRRFAPAAYDLSSNDTAGILLPVLAVQRGWRLPKFSQLYN